MADLPVIAALKEVLGNAGCTEPWQPSHASSLIAFDWALSLTEVGSFYSDPKYPKIGAHALTCGVTSSLMGGDFRSGALAGGFGKAATLGFDGVFTDAFAEGTAVAIVGGVAAEIGGGKFTNGALTAAYGYMFNQCSNGCPRKKMFDARITLGAQGGARVGLKGALHGGAHVNLFRAETSLVDGDFGYRQSYAVSADVGQYELGGSVSKYGSDIESYQNASFETTGMFSRNNVSLSQDLVVEIELSRVVGIHVMFNIDEAISRLKGVIDPKGNIYK